MLSRALAQIGATGLLCLLLAISAVVHVWQIRRAAQASAACESRIMEMQRSVAEEAARADLLGLSISRDTRQQASPTLPASSATALCLPGCKTPSVKLPPPPIVACEQGKTSIVPAPPIATTTQWLPVWSSVRTGRILPDGQPEFRFVQGLYNRRLDEVRACMKDVRQ